MNFVSEAVAGLALLNQSKGFLALCILLENNLQDPRRLWVMPPWMWLIQRSLELLWDAVLWAEQPLLCSSKQLCMCRIYSGWSLLRLPGRRKRCRGSSNPHPEIPATTPTPPWQLSTIMSETHVTLGGAGVNRLWKAHWRGWPHLCSHRKSSPMFLIVRLRDSLASQAGLGWNAYIGLLLVPCSMGIRYLFPPSQEKLHSNV